MTVQEAAGRRLTVMRWISAVFVLALIGALRPSVAVAQDEPGTVSVAGSKTIWQAAGMTVTQAQFSPDGKSVWFVARGGGKDLRAVIRPDGTGFEELPAGAAVAKSVAAAPVGGWPAEKCAASSPGGTLVASTRDLPSPVGIVRGAGLWVRPVNVKTTKQHEILSPKEWLVGVAYYKHMIAWAPPKPGEKDSRRVRFVGARLKPFPGKKHRPLCVWEVTISDKLERVGEPRRLGTFGWWPRYWRGDPALNGCTGWNFGLGGGQYMADFSTGRVYRFKKKAFGRGTRATYNPGCTLAALPGKTLRVLTLKKDE
jgi:hypothetical protein